MDGDVVGGFHLLREWFPWAWNNESRQEGLYAKFEEQR